MAVPISNPDIFWHLSAARRAVETGSVPTSDWLSFTMRGRPWVDFEWLQGLLWHGVHGAAGMPGLWALKSAVLGAAAWALWRLLQRAGLAGSEAAGLTLAWTLALSSANDLRPENASLLLFVLLLSALEARRASGPAALAREAGACAAGFAFWACLHPGWAYGLVLLCAYAAEEALRARRPSALALPAAAAAAAFLAVGPTGLGVLVRHAMDLGAVARFLNEWKPADPSDWRQWPFFALAAAALAAGWARRRSDPALGAAALFFLASALRHVRTAPYFSTAAVVLVALAAAELPAGRRRAGLAAVLALCAAFWAGSVPRALRSAAFFDPAFVPVRLAEFLAREKAALGALRMYNTWHWGGYLGWRLPGGELFQDGRYIFHPLLEEKGRALKSPEAFAAFLSEHRVDLVVLERGNWAREMPAPGKGGGTVRRPFYIDYLPEPGWLMAYWDPQGYAFVRRSAVPAEWAREHAYTALRLDDLEAAEAGLESGAVPRGVFEEEVRRHERDMGPSPDSVRTVL
ncbi:MAG: hypothetical protein HY928_16845 [Elusimicrobia bacterium]|nr:hypothetical protein [Elusimicrobiota bacterium]